MKVETIQLYLNKNQKLMQNLKELKNGHTMSGDVGRRSRGNGGTKMSRPVVRTCHGTNCRQRR